VRAIAGSNEVLVHCWRGGMRSSSMAWLLDMAGMKVYVLLKGYKAFRKYIHERYASDGKLIILGGMTGSGKTDILKHLKNLEQQVLDLEAFAHHKGSAFGALGQLPQPSTEQFENDIFSEWKNIDSSKYLWLEDESRAIGTVQIPEILYSRLRQSPVINIIVDKQERIQRLVREYASFSREELSACISKITQRLGGQHAKAALAALENNDFATVADITLTYYDKAYNYGLYEKRDKNIIHELYLAKDEPGVNAKKVLEFAERIMK
jgi:tRNA 2-selenouridine synthase